MQICSAWFLNYSGINIKRILSRGGNRIDHILDERNCLTLCIIHRSLHQRSAVSTLNLSGLHLACVISELDQGDLEKFEAVIDSGEYTGSVKELINLAQNLDCFEFYPGVTDDETLGRIYVEDMTGQGNERGAPETFYQGGNQHEA